MKAVTSIRNIMTPSVLAISPNDTIALVRDLILKNNIHHVPVVDDGHVVGMISMNDIHRMEHQFTQFNNKAAHAANHQLFNTMLAKEIMTTPVVKIAHNENVGKAVDIFLGNMFHALPVVDENENLIGIVTTFDLIRHSLEK